MTELTPRQLDAQDAIVRLGEEARDIEQRLPALAVELAEARRQKTAAVEEPDRIGALLRDAMAAGGPSAAELRSAYADAQSTCVEAASLYDALRREGGDLRRRLDQIKIESASWVARRDQAA